MSNAITFSRPFYYFLHRGGRISYTSTRNYQLPPSLPVMYCGSLSEVRMCLLFRSSGQYTLAAKGRPREKKEWLKIDRNLETIKFQKKTFVHSLSWNLLEPQTSVVKLSFHLAIVVKNFRARLQRSRALLNITLLL